MEDQMLFSKVTYFQVIELLFVELNVPIQTMEKSFEFNGRLFFFILQFVSFLHYIIEQLHRLK